MKLYDVKCPICGTLNHSLFLEETGGWMECEHCGQTVNALLPEFRKRVPVYTGEYLVEQRLMANAAGACLREGE